MQHKVKFSGLKIGVLLTAIVLVGGLAVLMMVDIPAPEHHFEKQLDIKEFLEQK